MTWDETIKFIRSQPEYSDLVKQAYLEENLSLNVERFRESEEFNETLSLLNKYTPNASRVLDIGSGNGVSAIAFALQGYQVTVCEPDPSETVGAAAIRILRDHYKLENLKIYEQYAEELKLSDHKFDLIYVRQAMHHAYNLKLFLKNLGTLVKAKGYLFTVRDHVVYDEEDKKWFLENHPLQKFYHGENAFTKAEYCEAIEEAGFTILTVLKHFDSVINYFPMSREAYNNIVSNAESKLDELLEKKLGRVGRIPLLQQCYKKWRGFDSKKLFDETKIPGRMYSFIAIKK